MGVLRGCGECVAGMWLWVAWNVLHEWCGKVGTGCYLRKHMTGAFCKVFWSHVVRGFWLVIVIGVTCVHVLCDVDRTGRENEVVVESTVICNYLEIHRVRSVAQTDKGGWDRGGAKYRQQHIQSILGGIVSQQHWHISR